LLTTIAASLGTALENARLFDETQQRNAELAIINSVQQGLVSNLDFQDVIDLVGDKIREIFNASNMGISTYNQGTNLIATHYLIYQGKRLPSEEATPLEDAPLRAHVIQSRKTLLINRDAEEVVARFETQPMTGFAGWFKSGLFVPIIVGDQVIGLIVLSD